MILSFIVRNWDLGLSGIVSCRIPPEAGRHLHVIIWWDVDKYKRLTISKIMQAIKGHSAKVIAQFLKTGRRKPLLSPYSAASEGSRLPGDYQLNYIHYNPVRAGLVKKPEDWLWSSYNDYEHNQPGLIRIEKNIV